VMAISALKYLQESRRKGVKVAGFDALQEAIAEIRSKRLAATVDQQASEQGYQGVALALRLTQGSSVPNVTTIDTRLVTAGNLP
jgi:ribose transport system substrate-binding protein